MYMPHAGNRQTQARGQNARLRPETRQPRRNLPVLRRYMVQGITGNGDLCDFQRVAPALDPFEQAFAAFARGTLIATEEGPVAVEDLIPGMRIQTALDGMQPLMWHGSITLVPNTPTPGLKTRLARVSADSFGLGRPMPDLMLGPAARLYQKNARLPDLIGADAACLPANGFVDGESVIAITPASPVQVFHLGFARHQIILANGLECESYHPGHTHEFKLSGEMLSIFLSLFPHIQKISDFGPMTLRRLSTEYMDRLRAA